MNPNVVLPLGSSILSLVFAALLADQWLRRRRSYQLVWGLGMLWYGLSAGTEALGGALGWSDPLYRTWYLIGAVWVAGWLGLGTVYLLRRTHFGYAFAASLFLAGLFTFLAQRRPEYADAGLAPVLYFAVAAVLAFAIVALTYRGDDRWPHLAALAIVGGSVVSALMMVNATIPAPGWAVDPITRIPVGTLVPSYLRLLTPFFNIAGAFALVLGALYSAYIFMPKRRLIRYSVDRSRGFPTFARGLVLAVAALPVNFVASLPGAFAALVGGRLHSRVPATVLIAIGAFIPGVTSGLNRFGVTWAFFLGEFLGVVFLFAGFLVSIEVFRDLRIPFTRVTLWRRADADTA